MERDFGDLDNKNMLNDFDISFGDYFNDERIIDNIPGVESLELLYVRAQKVLELIKKKPENTILLVAHGAFGRALMRVVKKQPHYTSIKSVDNAKIIKLI